MKKYCLFLVLMACVLGFAACDQSANTLSEPEVVPEPSAPSIQEMGQLHNEFLAAAFDELEKEVGVKGPVLASRSATAEQKTMAAFTAANRMLSQYNVSPMSVSAVNRAIESGCEMARNILASAHQTPDKLAGQALEGEVGAVRNGVASFTFYEHYVELRDEETSARQAYDEVSLELGVPATGSRLAVFFDILLASDVFWHEHYSDGDPMRAAGFDSGPELGWKKFVQFVTLAVVDGVAAAASSGAVGPVLGGIIGGLASWGANDILFG